MKLDEYVFIKYTKTKNNSKWTLTGANFITIFRPVFAKKLVVQSKNQVFDHKFSYVRLPNYDTCSDRTKQMKRN